MVKHLEMPPKGFTLTELLMTLAIVSMVFLGAISLYTTGLKFLGTSQAVDVSTSPAVALEQIGRYAALANTASLTQANSQLNFRLDSNCAGAALSTPENTGDDSWRHYRLVNNQLLSYCDNTPGPALTAANNPPGTSVLLANANTAASTIQLINPSASGAATVLSLHLVSTIPAVTIDTEVALGASSKR